MTRQAFDTVNLLRISVEGPPATGPDNVIPNPRGEWGSSGWESPIVGSWARGSDSGIEGVTFTTDVGPGTDTYRDAVLSRAPLAYYRLGETSGTTMADTSGNGRTGTHGSSVVLGTAGVVPANTAATYTAGNGTSGTSAVAAAAWMDVTTSLTLEVWVKTGAVAGTRGIFGRGNASGAAYQLQLVDNVPRLRIRTTSSTTPVVSGLAGVADNLWHHIVGTFDGTNARLYVDGVLVGTTSAAGSLYYATAYPLNVGGIGAPFGGIVDEAAMYGTVLTGAQIASNYNTATAATAPPVPYLQTERLAKTNAYAAGTVKINSLSAGCRVRAVVVFEASNGTQTTYPIATFTTIGNKTLPATFIDDSTNPYYRIRFYLDAGADTTVPAAGSSVVLDYVFVAVGPTVVGLTPAPGYAPNVWTPIQAKAHQVDGVRTELQGSEATVVLFDAAMDPSVASSKIVKGRRVQIAVFNGGSSGDILFTGKIDEADVAYDFTRSNLDQRAKITMTVLDQAPQLAAAPRPQGVATLAELAALLEGSGVPWKINGSSKQYPGVPVVAAVNESASLADQVAITRDTVGARAFVDRFGFLSVRSGPFPLSGGGSDDTVYVDAAIGYNTKRCINSITVKVLEINDADGSTVENTYGPFRDQFSCDTYGEQTAEFTVYGLDAAGAEAYATSVLRPAVSRPRVRINSVRFVARTALEAVARAGVDVGDRVVIHNSIRDLHDDSLVTRVEFHITPSKWETIWELDGNTGVAPPQVVAQLPATTSTWWPEVRMFYGLPSQVPAGWLPLNGAVFSAATCPLLAAHLGGTVLPDWTDRMPIGAGTKAVGSSGGDPTKTLVAANLPAHTDAILTGTAVGTDASRVARGNGAANGQVATTGSGSATPTPVDVMPPWRAIYFIIRAG